jgi:hypothetical protein
MRLIIIVEGKTEQEFVNEILKPYFYGLGFYDVAAMQIQTSKGFKGGFVSYLHLKRDVLRLLYEPNTLVTTFVDYFRIPTTMPNYSDCISKINVVDRIACFEANMKNDIGFGDRFIPYIQQHEFEALLFSSNVGFRNYFGERTTIAIDAIIAQYDNPEDINERPQTAPSKRILSIIPSYHKINDGNLIALEIGIQTIINRCPRFRQWLEQLTALV